MTRSDEEELMRRSECQREYRIRLKSARVQITDAERMANSESMRKKRDNQEFRERQNAKQQTRRRVDRVIRIANKEEMMRQLEEKLCKERQIEQQHAVDLADMEKERKDRPVVDKRIRERIQGKVRELGFQLIELEDQVRRGYIQEWHGCKEYASIVSLYDELSEKPVYWS